MEKDALMVVGMALLLLIAVLVGLSILDRLAYNSPDLPSYNMERAAFTWGDVFNLARAGNYKYEIISMSGGEINRTEALYTRSMLIDEYSVKVTPYSGLRLRSDVDASVMIDKVTYTCLSKVETGKDLGCGQRFSDGDAELAASIIPTIMRRNAIMRNDGLSNAIYAGKSWQAIRFTSPDGKVSVLVVDGIPLPVRIEISNEDGSKVIANLRSYQ